MKFKKVLTIGINESSLTAEYWKRIDKLTGKRVSISKDSSDLNKQLEDTDCMLVNPFVFKVEKGHIDTAVNLKYIGVCSTAYGKIDYKYASTKNIPVCNIPGYSTEAVAELALGVIIEQIRALERAKKQARDGNYSESTFFNTSEVLDKKFGVIGLGRIGTRVAELAKAFGANVCYWSRNRKKEEEAKGIKYQEIDKILSECDFISLHLIFNSETEHFMNKSRINMIKPNAILVNLAPNELVDINALDKRLSKGDLVYIADHADELTLEQAKLLLKHKNCVLYPPIGYTTKEATIQKQEIFVSNIEQFLKGTLKNKVN